MSYGWRWVNRHENHFFETHLPLILFVNSKGIFIGESREIRENKIRTNES